MHKPHALIIDDDRKSLNVLSQLLALQGVTCTSVEKPAALDTALAELDHVEVVFLDLEMPGLNGYNVFERLKSDARFSAVPVVACTVHLSEINVVHALGFHSFVGKPLDSDRFPEQLARILNGERVWEAS